MIEEEGLKRMFEMIKKIEKEIEGENINLEKKLDKSLVEEEREW